MRLGVDDCTKQCVWQGFHPKVPLSSSSYTLVLGKGNDAVRLGLAMRQRLTRLSGISIYGLTVFRRNELREMSIPLSLLYEYGTINFYNNNRNVRSTGIFSRDNCRYRGAGPDFAGGGPGPTLRMDHH